MNTITFDATVNKVQTLTDGGLRVVFDLPETDIEAVKKLMECKRDEVFLRVACVAQDGTKAD